MNSTHEDELAIRTLVERMGEGWAHGDADEYAAVFAEDARYVNAPGTRVVGRQAIADSHRKIFRTVFAQTHLGRSYPSELQWLTPEVALLHAAGSVLFATDSEEKVPPNGLITMVAVRGASGWELASFNNTQTGKARNLFFLLRYLRSRLGAMRAEWRRGRHHMMENKRRRLAMWNKSS